MSCGVTGARSSLALTWDLLTAASPTHIYSTGGYFTHFLRYRIIYGDAAIKLRWVSLSRYEPIENPRRLGVWIAARRWIAHLFLLFHRGTQSVTRVSEWPGQEAHKTDSKVPTLIWYDQHGNVSSRSSIVASRFPYGASHH